MTDYELLVHAAEAHGEISFDRMRLADVFFAYRDGKQHHWNPLTNDADAFQLAVDLCLSINPCNYDVGVVVWDTGWSATETWEAHAGNKCAATRRAIVRAAVAHHNYQIAKHTITTVINGRTQSQIVADQPAGEGSVEQIDNTLLIAASPDLLKALRNIKTMLGKGIWPEPTSYNPAIAKATGCQL